MAETSRSRRTLTVSEAADVFGISRSHAYSLAQDDRLPVPVIRLGRKMVVAREAVERLLGHTSGDARSGSVGVGGA